MILADTSVWVDHFRRGDAKLKQLLSAGLVSTHAFVITELALGSLADRKKKLTLLELLPQVTVARTEEVRRLVEAHALFGKGVGFVDVHLIAATLLTPDTILWTRDRRLREVAMLAGAQVE
jgi:predicted nucleic acid-binding protein